MTDTRPLFEPCTPGSLTFSNRVVLAPLTRNRAGAGFVPSEFAATDYSQRASAGLLISEATQISRQGPGYRDRRRPHRRPHLAGVPGRRHFIDYPSLADAIAQ